MLTELHVEHLGVIDALSLVLGDGLIAITGETGAGKTLITEAIGLLTGARAGAELVRPEATEARVEGRFVEGDDEHVLVRVQPRQGRSRSYVDGRLATAAQLGELGERWVERQGQHDQQGLARRRVQREALDRHASIDTSELRAARARLTEVHAELAALGGDRRARAREIDLLRHQIDEIARSALHDLDEEQHLDAEQDLLADAVEHRGVGEATVDVLGGDDGVLERLGLAVRSLDGRRPFVPYRDRLQAVVAELDDLTSSLRHELDHLEEDPQRLQEVIERRQHLRDLRRRYGDTLGEVVAFAEAARQRLDELSGYDERADRLEHTRQQIELDVQRLARQVGDARRAAAADLGGAVTEHLRLLALPHAALTVTVGDADTDPAGDAVAFWFTANPGLDAMPLTRVASGGELSRIMLALRLVLGGGPDTLVFDEVDAGLGGEAAAAVAAALDSVSRDRQVVVVTHLAQVAARARQHLVVDKRVVEGRTIAVVIEVSGEERVAEIARMLSGRPQGDRARQHAAELLGLSQASGIDTTT